MFVLLICFVLFCCSFFFFFFQAEDGIRDGTVTGVQTCALPISRTLRRAASAAPKCSGTRWRSESGSLVRAVATIRSEERRVGKSVDLGGRRIIKKKKKKNTKRRKKTNV